MSSTTRQEDWRDGMRAPLRGLLRAEMPIVSIVVVYCAAVLTICAARDIPIDAGLFMYNRTFFLLLSSFVIFFTIGYAVYVMLYIRPRRLTHYLVTSYRDRFLRADRLLPGVVSLFAVLPFITAFTLMKSSIHKFQPFTWDRQFAELDKWMHGGVHPWEILQPLLGMPYVTTAVNAVYHAWFFILFAVLFWQAFNNRDPLLRLRFFISFLLTWAIVGSFFAVLLSSAGPVYYERIVGEEGGYAALFAYLNQASEHVPVWALNVQEKLWTAYEARSLEKGVGISAMPSMHVAVAVLIAFLARSYGKWLFGAAVLFALLIQIGSVHLGWHYAIDGYLSFLLVAVIWGASGAYARRFLRPRPPVEPATC